MAKGAGMDIQIITHSAAGALRPTERNLADYRCSLRGRVVNSSGRPITGARIWFQHSRYEGVSQSDGFFEIPGVPPGIWDMVVQQAGFKSKVLAEVFLQSGIEEFGKIILDEC